MLAQNEEHLNSIIDIEKGVPIEQEFINEACQ
jgi:hypothetical protein